MKIAAILSALCCWVVSVVAQSVPVDGRAGSKDSTKQATPMKVAPGIDQAGSGPSKTANDTSSAGKNQETSPSERLARLEFLITTGLLVGILAFLGNFGQAMMTYHATRESRRQNAALELQKAARAKKVSETFLRCLQIDLNVLANHLQEILYDLEDINEARERASLTHRRVLIVPIADTIRSSWRHLAVLSPPNAAAVRLLSAELTQLSGMLEKLWQHGSDEQIQDVKAFAATVRDGARSINLDSDIAGYSQ